MCIGYAFRPRLSSRLTRSGRTFLLKPEAFGHYDSHIILATHSGILTSIQSTRASAHASPRIERSPTNSGARRQIPDFRCFLPYCLASLQFLCMSPVLSCAFRDLHILNLLRNLRALAFRHLNPAPSLDNA